MTGMMPTPSPEQSDARALGINVLGSLVAAGILLVVNILTKSGDLGFWIAILVLTTTLFCGYAYTRRRERKLRAKLNEIRANAAKQRDATGLIDFREGLEHSDQHPREKLANIGRYLDFMGHGASKWSNEISEMREMLRRVSDRPDGRVRLLLVDPRCKKCEDGDKPKVVRSLLRLQPLVREYGGLGEGRSTPLFEVRLYSHLPHFRVTLVDNQCVVGHYLASQKNSRFSPLLIWDSDVLKYEWTFYTPFSLLFEREWKASEAVDWSDVAEQARELEVVA